MTPLHSFAAVGDRVGWVLVHTVWQFLLIALVAIALIRVLRHGPAMVRYAMLLVALAAMVMMPMATWMMCLPRENLARLAPAAAQDATADAIEPAMSSSGEVLRILPIPESQGRQAELSSGQSTAPAAAPAGVSKPWWLWMELRLRPWLSELAAVWSVGVLVFSLRPIWSWLTVQRLRRVGVRAVPKPVQVLLCRAAERLRIRHRVQVLQSTLVPTPVIIGGFRPLILLPVSVVTGLPAAAVEAILVHELAHLRRHDYIVNLLQMLIETIFFYHPAVWWLSHQIRCERENCCDDVAVAALGSPVAYGRALLALEEQRGATTALAIGARGGSLLARMHRFEHGTHRISAWQTATAAAVTAVPALVIAIGVWSMARADEHGGAAPDGAKLVMSADEQEAWNRLEATGAIIYGKASHRQHLRRHLASLEQAKFPEKQRKQIRKQIGEPIHSADMWNVPAEAWSLIPQLESLHELNVTASDLSDEAFRQIAKLPNLRRLRIISSNALPIDVGFLKDAKKLERLEITFSVFDEPAERRQEWLGELTEAEQAWAEDYGERTGGRQHIIEAAILTDRVLEELGDLPNLKTLRLVNTSISARGVEAIAVHAGLEELDVSIADFTPEAARAIGRLTRLRSFRYADVTDESLAPFVALTTLEELELWAEGVTDAGIGHLLPLRSLRKLALRGSSITDSRLLDLATLRDLERLDLSYAKGGLTQEGLIEFQRRRPQCRLIADGVEFASAEGEQAAATPAGAAENADAAGAGVGADQSEVSADQPLRLWKVRVVDGESDQPLAGIEVRAARGGGSQSMSLISDADGLIEVPVPEGTAVGLGLGTRGWWTESFHFVGSPNVEHASEAAGEVADGRPAKVGTLKLWRGTSVTGRLVLPGGDPAAGVPLNVGVYITSRQWKERLGMALGWQSWDHGQWPNWTVRIVTDEEGKFETTVPPPDARSWVRVGTTSLSFSSSDPTSAAGGARNALASFAPFERQFGASPRPTRARDVRLNFGDLQLERGVVLRGRVVDAGGDGLAGVILHTSSKHGPYAGRSTISGEEGRFEFLPMHPGNFTIRPDARLRDESGKVVSRDVLAVFVPQPFDLADSDEPVEAVIRAVPHVTLEFEWIDRRAEKGPVAYYGTFPVSGNVPTADGSTVSWRGETERTTRDGREILFVKVPRSILNPVLTLPADSVVTASYDDDQQASGPGKVILGDVTQPKRRIVYGDEPKPQ